ncbi:MAG: hypothetical protein ACI4BD_00965 [Paludibacteraceae bacterium]
MNQVVTIQKNLLPTKEMEKWMVRIQEDIVRYRRVEQSAELKEFRELQQVVETAAFQEKKHILLTRKYWETEEFKKLARLHVLRNHAPAVHGYLLYHVNEELRNYLVFAASEDYRKLQDKEAVKASAELRRYRMIDRSLTLRNYRKCESSPAVKEYLSLVEETSTEDFQARRAFWSNSKRWYTTPESQQDARYTTLKETDDIQFFLAQDPKQIAEWERYKRTLSDDFETSNPQDGNWESGFYYSNPNLKTDHSYVNEQQANNHGKNVQVQDGVLSVELRKEEATASAWHPVKGFVPQAFHYTGDVVQTGKKFQQTEGLFMAKVRFQGGANGAAYLGTGTRLPLITLAQWNGKQVAVGIRTAKGTETAGKQVILQGTQAGKWLIYSVMITAKEIAWYVNDQEVLRLPNTVQGTAFYPAIAEYLPEQVKADTGKVEVDWVKAYTY